MIPPVELPSTSVCLELSVNLIPTNESLKERTRYQTQPRREQQQLEQRERSDWGESLKERSRYQTLPRQKQQQLERRNQSVRDQPSLTAPPRLPRSSHDRYYKQYSDQLKRDRHYRRHETYHYHTHYLAPIKRHYLPLYYRVRVLPHTYVRIVVHSLPYFYFDGIFYRHYIGGGYIVVRAPIGAVVHVLPVGFIAFSLGAFIYYYANDTYYLWDDEREAYIVVEKPDGAEAALAEATEGRIFAYPSQGQSEEQQARDRYECHRWAVTETRADPTLDDENNLSYEDKRNYKRAISACLEGRGYTVK